MPELGSDNALDPITALQTYLANREDLADIAEDMLQAAQALLQDETIELRPPEEIPDLPSVLAEGDHDRQLRLL